MDKQNNRETVVCTVAAMLRQKDPDGDHTKQLIALDALVCEGLGIDQDVDPPEYIIPH